MNELMKLTKGSALLPDDKKKGLAAMQKRLGVKAVTLQAQSSVRLIALVFDATASMDCVWQEAKANIKKLVTRQRELTPQAKLVLVAYRDYCDGNDLLKAFSPSADTDKLVSFLDSINCNGGGDDPEAVETALERVLELKPDLAILVGDAPPHGVIDAIMKGKDYREYAQKLGKSGIPVYTISTNSRQEVISSFGEIAKLSGGKGFQLSQVNELIDLLSVATAKKTQQLGQLSDILKRENGGRLTAKQERLLIDAAKT